MNHRRHLNAMMSGKTSPAQGGSGVASRSFYGVSPPKRSRLHDSETNTLRPTWKTFSDNVAALGRRISDSEKKADLSKPTTPTTTITIDATIEDESQNQQQQQQENNQPLPLQNPQPRVGADSIEIIARESSETKSLDRDSPIPLKNLGNTCYENSIIQCLFNLNMFMDNFEKSMKDTRKLIVKTSSVVALKSLDLVQNGQDEKQPPKTESESENSAATSTINEDDVRYRIANAFDNLYKTYIKKRNQFDLANSNQIELQAEQNQASDLTKPAIDSTLSAINLNAAISESKPITLPTTSTAIPLSSSDDQVGQLTDLATTLKNIITHQATSTSTSSNIPCDSLAWRADSSISLKATSSTTTSSAPITTLATTTTTCNGNTTTDASATSNLTPIALVSSNSTPSEQAEIETRLEELKSAVGERSSQFNSAHQQDASEFFYHVIDSIQEFYQGLQKSNDDDNPVTKAFELELDYLIRCPKCRHRNMSSGPEKIRTLPLTLPHVNAPEEFGANDDATSCIPTPPTSDLGLDSPKSNESSEDNNIKNNSNQKISENASSDEKENLVDSEEGDDDSNNDSLAPRASPHSDNSNNTMSIANLDLTDKPDGDISSTKQTAKCAADGRNQQEEKHYTLGDALNNYFKDDLLEYACSQSGCDSKHRTRKCLIRKLPQVLFITLARYSYTGKKSLDEIEAPFELSVPFQENKSPSHSPSAHRDFQDGDNNYQLLAVVCHLGSSLNAGHYTSYVYNQNNFSWYSCDDDSIVKVQEDDVKSNASKCGYCFFYAHKSLIAQKQDVDDGDIVLEKVSTSSTSTKTATTTISSKQELGKGKHLPEGSESMVVSSSVADSSILLTPNSSPRGSQPSPKEEPTSVEMLLMAKDELHQQSPWCEDDWQL